MGRDLAGEIARSQDRLSFIVSYGAEAEDDAFVGALAFDFSRG